MKLKEREIITDFAVDELEELKGDVVEPLVDRSDDGFDGSFDGLDTRFKWTRVLLGEFVEAREADNYIDRRHLNEIQIFEIILSIL